MNMSAIGKESMTLDEAFPYNANMAASTTAGMADQIRIWDYENQTYRYFYMYLDDLFGDPERDYHWVENVSGDPLAKVTLKTGDAIFYYPYANNFALTVPGQVPSEASGVLKQGFNMIGVGFPAQWNPNDAGTDFWSDAKFAKSTTAGMADQIRYWDKAQQKYRYFYLFLDDLFGDPERDNKWVENVQGDPVLTEKLDTGDGFFYYRLNEGQIEFKPGLKL